MANWKKVIVSGSTANLAALQVDNLTSGQVVIGGGASNLSTTAINGSGNILATEGATGVSITGSFTGSFTGTFTGTTNLPDLTQGTGIDVFTYDGSATATVAVSGASTLNADTLTKWTGNAFANTNITDNGSLVNINTDTTVTGSLTVSGSNITLIPNVLNVSVDNGLSNIIYAESGSGFELFDINNGNRAIWVDTRRLMKSDGTTVAFDWENGSMTGSLNVTGSSVVFKTDYLQVWKGSENVTLIDIGAGNVNLYDANGSGSIDVASRLAKDDIENPSIDWNSRQLIDSASAASVEWNQRYLNDSIGNNSVDWQTRQLIKSDGTAVAFDWENGQMTGSLTVTGSQVELFTDLFRVNTPDGSVNVLVVDSNGVQLSDPSGNQGVEVTISNRKLYDSASFDSVDWNNRQLIKSDGTTVSVDWENGTFTGSFTGSFVGDGSQLTGLVSTLNISGSTGGGTVDLQTQTLTIAGTVNEIETSATGQTITIGLPNDVTIGNNLTVSGDLIVNGTTTVINTTNTAIEDQFILLASGSTSTIDAGIIVQNAANAGEAFYWENNPGSVGRWAIASNIAPTATTVAAAEYMVSAVTTAGAPASAPTYGGATTGYGNIHVNSSNGDIYIYA